MVPPEGLAEKKDRHDAAKHRHQVNEQPCPVGTDQFDTTVIAEIGDDRRKNRDLADHQQAGQFYLHDGHSHGLPEVKRQEHDCADPEDRTE